MTCFQAHVSSHVSLIPSTLETKGHDTPHGNNKVLRPAGVRDWTVLFLFLFLAANSSSVPHLPGEGCKILCQLPSFRSFLPLLPSAPAFRLACLLLVLSSSSSSNCDPRSTLFGAGRQPRPSMLSVPCRTSTTTIHAQCPLPDLNREYQCEVFPAGPHVRRYVR